MDSERRAILQSGAIAGAIAGVNAIFPRAFAQSTSSSGNSVHGRSMTDLKRGLSNGSVTSRQLVEDALAAINDPNGEGKATFIKVHAKEALQTADAIDAQRKKGVAAPDQVQSLAGIPISLKDLFDEAGETTLGGSIVLIGQPAATQDATVVRRLREAGAIIIGRTNTVEFAYTGLGINPHYGTPKNVFDRATGRIPGGSTSGGAISVADGMAAAAIGTDTGGSLRIPSALNGLVGFKPTQGRVSRDGVMPLSTSFDSAGPIGWTVEDCAFLDGIIADHKLEPLAPLTAKQLRLAVPQTYFQDALSPEVAKAFGAALSKLSAAGAKIVELPMTEFAMTPTINPKGMITACEAYAWHRKFIKDGADKYDPRVLARIKTGETILAVDYVDLQTLRREYIRKINAAANGFDAMLMPTTPDIAPPISEVLKDDETYYRINARMLRNPSAVNIFDGCALSVPCHESGAAPVGLMIAGTQNQDQHILAVGQAIEAVVAPKRT
jgi:aspartyl-tRNA(Asn)/glutamyl-tRNA(Gln) amidotransferase subunit A